MSREATQVRTDARARGRARVLILSFSPIVSDARVLKQVRLLAADHDVTTCGYGPAPEGVVDHVEVPADRPAWSWSRAALLTRRYRRAYWGNPAVAFARGALADRRFDVVLADDVDTVGLAMWLEPRCGVHADLHEYAPRQKEDLLRWRLFVAPFVRWVCRRFVARARSWTTEGEGIAAEYERRFGFRPRVVTNATPYTDLAPVPTGRTVRLVHSGAALADRHLETLVDAVATSRAAVTLDLYLTPNDPAHLADLRERAAAHPGRVTVREPVPYDALVATLHRYDVGVMVLAPVTFNYRWALPNKVFDYVQARLGLIVGPSPEMARLVREAGVGAVTEDFSLEALVRALDALDPATVDGWKQASADRAHELSSESQVVVWAEAIDRLLDRPV